jgi:hypothetical protein
LAASYFRREAARHEAARRNRVLLFAGENIAYRPAIQKAIAVLQIRSPRILLASSLNSLEHGSPSQLNSGILFDLSPADEARGDLEIVQAAYRSLATGAL